jgi:putative hydrolase of the HAD superfamily
MAIRRLSRPRAILLDALGTLVALAPPAPILRRELASRLGLEVSEAEAHEAIAAEFSYYRAHLDEGRDPDALVALRRRCAEAMRSVMPPPAARLDIDALTGALLASLHFSAFVDAAPALELARSRAQRLVVVSNWDISLPDVLARLGLAGLVDGVVTSAGAGARKPSPEIFAQALEIAGIAARDAVHVGDTIDEDVIGARNAGIEAILLRRDGGPAPPGVRVIASLRELDSA